MFRATWILVLAMVLLGGCTALKGPYYLNLEQYDEGIEVFSAEIAEDPDNASAHYYMARYLLAKNAPQDAYGHIEKAVQLEPENDEYHFWKGITHWALSEFDKEEASYRKALSLNSRNLYAHLYLGHNLLDSGNDAEALAQYEEVLTWDDYDPEALFYKAKALHGLKRYEDEREAWLNYLEYYPDGHNGLVAVDALNDLGEYSWRNHYIGKRRVSLQAIAFEKGTATLSEDAKPSLQVLGSMLKHNKGLTLHIVSYVEGDAALAKERALQAKEYVLGYYSDVSPDQLIPSWFGVAETVKTAQGDMSLNEAVNIITAVN